MEDIKKFPTEGLGHYEIQDRLIEFEKMSHFMAFNKNFFDEGPHLTSSKALPWGDEIRERSVNAWLRFMHGEIWHTGVGARQMEREVISMMGYMFHNPEAVGFMTTGGSESNTCALIAAKGKAFVKEFPELIPGNLDSSIAMMFKIQEFGSKPHSVVLPYHSHYSLFKACALLGLQPIPVFPISGTNCSVNTDDIQKAIRDDTIAIVGTAGTWPFGTLDPIDEMGKIAMERDLYFHVDSCFGGYIIPFLEAANYYKAPLKPWDFRVPGVCSISADLHKNGMVPPGASSLFFRNKLYRDYARLMAPPHGNVTGTRGTGSIAAAWTMLMSLGLEGYKAVAMHSKKLQDDCIQKLTSIPEIKVVPGSVMNLNVIYSETLDLRPVFKALIAGEWNITTHDDPKPVGLCVCCMPQNDGMVDQFVNAFQKAVKKHAVPVGTLGDDYSIGGAYGLELD